MILVKTCYRLFLPTITLRLRDCLRVSQLRFKNPRTEEGLIGLALLFLRSVHFVLKPGPSRTPDFGRQK